MEASTCSTCGRFNLEQRELTEENKNEMRIVSVLNSNFIERVIQFLVDKEAQK